MQNRRKAEYFVGTFISSDRSCELKNIMIKIIKSDKIWPLIDTPSCIGLKKIVSRSKIPVI